ncbi:hypothetical protein V5O48_016643 [Marasmius crinis-equi]|uniref:MYND-type domain-containing protein n=1 Tax=Marasmius crinis-equi TaxID=585013 RepID=A0ABR3ER54_9AGAR
MKEHAEVAHKLMLALGYNEYVTQGGDWGGFITRTMATIYGQNHLKAWHTNMPVTRTDTPADADFTKLSTVEKSVLDRTKWYFTKGNGYYVEQSTVPQTIGYSMSDSPVGLLAWIYEKLVVWTDSYAWEDDEILTWISIYWFSRSGPAATARTYYEVTQMRAALEKSKTPTPKVSVPTGFSYFHKDLIATPVAWITDFESLVFHAQHEKGGHFAAHEVPELLVGDLRKMFGKGGPAYGVSRSGSFAMTTLAAGFMNSQFTDESFRRFQNIDNAIRKLRQIGVPPSSVHALTPNILEDVLQVFGALVSAKMTFRLRRATNQNTHWLESNWANLIGPWILFIVQELIPFTDVDGTITPQILDCIQKSMWTIPLFLILLHELYDHQPAEVEMLRQSTPGLDFLIVQTWYKVLQQYHPATATWTILIFTMLDRATNRLSMLITIDNAIPVSVEEADIALIRHINREAQRIPTTEPSDLMYMREYLAIHGSWSALQYDHKGQSSTPFAILETLPSLAGFVFKLLYKRKSLQRASIGDMESKAAHLALQTLEYTSGAFAPVYLSVCQILDAGLISALFKVSPCFFECDLRSKQQEKIPSLLCEFLDKVSKLLVYPTILHTFLTQTKKATGGKLEKLEEEMRSKSEELWAGWRRTIERANLFRDLRRSFKAKGVLLKCGYEQCGNSYKGVQFLRCTGCSVTIYCSRECRKLDWAWDHRNECSGLRRDIRSEKRTIYDDDYHFFQEFISYYIQKYLPKIMDSLAELRSSAKSGNLPPDDLRLVDYEKRNPFVILDFEKAENPFGDDCIVLAGPLRGASLLGRAPPTDARAYIAKWSSPQIHRNNFLVLALMPGSARGLPCVVDHVFQSEGFSGALEERIRRQAA